MKYSVVTFGCRVNQSDSLAFEAALQERGGEAVPSDRAELVIVNTCSVTASADQGARQTIRRIARENPGARIVATGCYATRCSDDVAALPGVAAVVPNDRKAPAAFFRALRTLDDTLVVEPVGVDDGPCGRPLAPGLMGRTAWTLRVQTGCEEQCSYCIIPTTRGASRSRPFGDVAAEVARVTAAGYKEIVITGVHLGAYGRDLSPRGSLAALLPQLLDLPARGAAGAGERGGVLYRISSLEPMDFPLEILDAAAGHPSGPATGRSAIAPHFHLPLQHASNRMLESMRRPYSIDAYDRLVCAIRERLPHAALGSDVIVGFPGETNRDFAALVDYLEQSPLTHLHVFPYSDRPGTAAASLPGRVDGAVVKARGQRLREVSRQLAAKFLEGQRGTVRPALAIEDGSIAMTDNYLRVPAPPGHARNDWISVTV